MGTVPEATNKIAASLYNEWVTLRYESFIAQTGSSQQFGSELTTMENNDGTITNARCIVPRPGSMPNTTPDDWPALFELCASIPYQDADPAAVTAWAKDAVQQLLKTTPGPTPVFQMTDLNCLHWQVGWQEAINPDDGYQDQIALDLSTGFSALTADGGDDGFSPDHPTAYGCPS